MKICFFFLIFLCPTLVFSQLNFSTNHPEPNMVLHDVNQFKAPFPDGNLAVYDYATEITNQPYLQNDWSYAVILFENDNWVSDSFVKYSLYSNQLFFQRNDMTFPVPYAAKEFWIRKEGDTGQLSVYHFKNGFPQISGNNKNTLYRIIRSSNDYDLLEWTHKKLADNYQYGGPSKEQFVPVQEFFVFDKKTKKMKSLGRKIDATTVSQYFGTPNQTPRTPTAK